MEVGNIEYLCQIRNKKIFVSLGSDHSINYGSQLKLQEIASGCKGLVRSVVKPNLLLETGNINIKYQQDFVIDVATTGLDISLANSIKWEVKDYIGSSKCFGDLDHPLCNKEMRKDNYLRECNVIADI